MKKTVIKRRKRVPAVGAAGGRGDSVSEQSPAPSHDGADSEQATATIPRETPVPLPSSSERPVEKTAERTTPLPERYSNTTPDGRTLGPVDPVTGVRRPQPKSVPLVLPVAGPTIGKKLPWWLDDRRDTRKKEPVVAKGDEDKEGVSRPGPIFLRNFFSILPSLPSSFQRV